MTIGFITGIPASNDNPSVDQPNMQSNNDAIYNFANVDLIGFTPAASAGTTGQHRQVTFSVNNPPSLPTTPPILFTNTQDGYGNNLPASLAQLFFYTGSATQSQKNYAYFGGNGSTMLMGGFILKWGTNAVGGSGTANITYASMNIGNFPNNCFLVWAWPLNETNPAIANSFVYTNTYTTSSFNVVGCKRTTLAALGLSFGFVAIGN